MQTNDLSKKGIYGIFNLIIGKYYIGSVTSSTFEKRFKTHKNRLLSGTHENQPHHKGLIFRFVDDDIPIPLIPKQIWHKFKSFEQCVFYKNRHILEQSNKEKSCELNESPMG